MLKNAKIGVKLGVGFGIVTRPTLAMIGEDGAEAVVSLTKPSRANQIMNQITNNRSNGGSYVFSPTINVNRLYF